MIQVEHLSKTYGTTQVLKDVSVEIRKGEVISVIGPSGTGKSTFLRCLNLLERPTGGTIRIDGVNLLAPDTDVPLVRRKMNMVFQGFNLFAHLSVLRNLTLGPVRLGGMSQAQADREAMDLLRLVGLGEKAHSFPAALSGGQKQRVAIARCLAMKPEIILFDEPTSALDPTMVREVLSVIHRLARDGMTMVIVTHEMAFARDVSNRVLYMDEGTIYESGEPGEIFNRPQKPKTQAFINRIRSFRYRIQSPDYDLYAMNAEIETFCERQILPWTTRHNLLLLVEEMLQLHRADTLRAGLDLIIAYSEKLETLEVVCESSGPAGDPLAASAQEDDLGLAIIRSLAETLDYQTVDGRHRLTVRMKNT